MALYDGPIVDAHHHLWRYRPEAYPWLAADDDPRLRRDQTDADYFAAARGAPISASVWVEALHKDPLAEAAEALALAADHEGLAAGLVAHAPLDADDIEDRLDALMATAPRVVGVRDIVACRPGHNNFCRSVDLLERPAFARGLEACRRRGLVFDLLLEPWQMQAALAATDRLPGLKVAIEHAGSPDFRAKETTVFWRAAMAEAARRPDIFVKISALHCRMPGWTDARLSQEIRFLVQCFGPQRLALASDFPTHDRTTPAWRAWESFRAAVADLSPSEQRAMFRDSAISLYGLGRFGPRA